MKTEDVNQFKGLITKALQDWGNAKIDELVPKRAMTKVFLKNGLNNLLAKYEGIMGNWIGSLFLFVADENGVVDSEAMLDTLAGLFKEMPKNEYRLGAFNVVAGGGEMIISFPHNFLMDMLVGDMGSLKLTADDILDLKEMFV